MVFKRLEIPDLVVCEPEIHKDDRGLFFESYRKDKLFKFLGYKINFCQSNQSESNFGILRGLHYQMPPYEQTKLVRVIQGSVLDVAVDLRKDSSTFGKHISIELNDKNKKQLLIPKGFAHGFVVLSKKATFSYLVDNYYNKSLDRGIIYNDKNLNIDWRLEESYLSLSFKDLNLPDFDKAEYFNLSNNH